MFAAPAKPAFFGTIEMSKDLGKAIRMMVCVFNISENADFRVN